MNIKIGITAACVLQKHNIFVGSLVVGNKNFPYVFYSVFPASSFKEELERRPHRMVWEIQDLYVIDLVDNIGYRMKLSEEEYYFAFCTIAPTLYQLDKSGWSGIRIEISLYEACIPTIFQPAIE